MSISIRMEFRDRVMAKFANQLKSLGGKEGHRALARAVNHTGKKAHTAVRTALAAQTSIKKKHIHNAVKTKQVRPGKVDAALEYTITGSGKELPLKFFGPSQIKKGISVKVWGQRRHLGGGFMGPRPGLLAQRLGGHAWHRMGAGRMPIQKMYGPSISKELVKDQSAAAFENASAGLVDRVGHEINWLLTGGR